MRKLLLPALLACSMLAISAPVVTASTHKAHAAASAGAKASKALGLIKGLKKAVANIVKINIGQTSSIHDVDLRVDKVVATLAAVTAGVPAIVDGLTALKAGLTTVGAGLTSLSAAVQDGTTGLVGLNNARPQFGAFGSTGAFVEGTGAHPPAKGPSAAAFHSGGPGVYVVDFGNDVSSRFLSVDPFPGSAGAGTPQAVDCAATGAAATCGSAQGIASDANPNHVLVLFGAGGTAAAAGFSVAAISG